MSIPESVRRQAEEADRLLEQYSAREAPQTEQPEEPEEPAEPELKEPVEEPKPTPTARDDDDLALWRQRYSTLQGKYNAEVGRVASENSELKSQLQQLKTQVAELAKSKQSVPEPDPTPLVRPEDAENFGSDMIDLVRRVAQEAVNKRENELGQVINELKSENAKLKESLVGVEQRTGQTAQDIFFDRLAELVPDWQQINESPRFLDWLEKPDPLTGQARQVLLDAAYRALNTQRTAAFFDAYKKETGVVAPPPTSETPAPPKPARQPAPPEVARQVQPGRSKVVSTVPAQDPAAKIWSSGEIDQFYRDVSLGKYREHEDLRARTEAEIDLAAAQGRVRP